MKLILRLFINAAALWAAAEFVDGIQLTGDTMGILFVAAIFGIANTIVKPILTLFSVPFIVLTLGFFYLVVNAIMLLITDALTSGLNVEGFWAAFWGAVVISLVSSILDGILVDKKEKERR